MGTFIETALVNLWSNFLPTTCRIDALSICSIFSGLETVLHDTKYLHHGFWHRQCIVEGWYAVVERFKILLSWGAVSFGGGYFVRCRQNIYERNTSYLERNRKLTNTYCRHEQPFWDQWATWDMAHHKTGGTNKKI